MRTYTPMNVRRTYYRTAAARDRAADAILRRATTCVMGDVVPIDYRELGNDGENTSNGYNE